MIHIGTAHYRDDRWVDVQVRWIARNTGEPHRTYASLDGVAAHNGDAFDVALEHTDVAPELNTAGRIEAKLDRLTARMVGDAEPGDPIVIVHGDTLPLPGWAPALRGCWASTGSPE